MVSATVGGVTIIAQVVVQVSSSNVSAPPVLQTSLSSTSISSASPATVTATLTDGKGQMVAGEVVTFTVVRGLAKTNIGTALTDPTGKAVVILSPVASTVAGADEVSASVTYAGTTLQSTKGFQIQATNVTLSSFTSAVASISAYGQTTLSLGISGASVGSPVSISVTSSCVSQGKATLSPTTFTATTSPVLLQYKDNGCGALQATDQLQASIVGGSGSVQLTPALAISRPDAASLAFISASPEVIYIKGSGFTETSTLTFEVRDFAGNTLPNLGVNMTLLTLSGGVTIESGPWNSNAAGRVTVRVNAGTVPTPIRVAASLLSAPAIATVSSNLSVAVGLPSQLNFSLSQQYFNVEGFDIDGSGIPNTITTCGNSVACNFYNIVASDRNGNPVPDGTSINFVTEGGQIQPIVRTSGSPVTAGASALFRASSPRPDDGRITVTAYALGEESFIDQNGNNTYDPGEPFQDLGNLFKDRLFDGVFDVSVDEYIPTNIANGSACVTPPFSGPAFNGTIGVTPVTSALLALDPGIPSVGGSTCDGVWSGAGKVYVRRATETVLSTSAARALWSNTAGLDALCAKVTLQNGPQTANTGIYTQVAGSGTWYANDSTSTTLSFIVGDANIFPALSGAGAVGRLNPMAAGTTVAATATLGLGVAFVGGSPVPSTREASTASVGVSFVTATSGTVFVTFRSPGGTGTTYAIPVTTAARPSACP
jgi:hypothetical protein